MATLVNDRNQLLFSASSRVTGASITLSGGTTTSLIVPKNATNFVPSAITLTANIFGYITPSFSWSYRFGDTGDWVAISGTTNPLIVNFNTQYLISAGANTVVQYKATVSETASNIGVNQSEAILSVPILREGEDGVDAINSLQVTLYKRTEINQAPTIDTAGNSTFNFSSGQVVGQPTGWSQAITDATSGAFLWVIQVLAASVTTSYAFPNTLWSEPALFSKNGTDGEPGTSTAIVYAYKRTTTAPTDNPGDATYSFSTNTISTATLANNWSKSIPSGGDPLYTVVATASSLTTTDSILAAEWSSPVLLVQNGTNGINTAAVFLYARNFNSTTAPVVPTTGTSTYTFANGVLSGTVPAGWTQALPAESSGSVIWITQAAAASTGISDQIPNTQWSTPVVLAQKGATGDPGTNGLNTAIVYAYRRSSTVPTTNPGEVTYSFTSKTFSSTLANSWTEDIPSGTLPLYVVAATASSNTNSDSIAAAEWSSPRVLAQNGLDGLNSATVFIYAKNNSTTTAPSISTTGTGVYEFATGLLTGTVPAGWSSTVPATGGKILWVRQATASSNTGTDDIPNTQWSTARVLAESGVDGTPGTNGTNGTRGSRQLYSSSSAHSSSFVYLGNPAGAVSYATKATDLIATATAGSIPTTPIQGDTVTFTNGTSYVYTITYNSSTSAWELPGTVIDGSLLVTGSVTAAKINSSGLEVKAPDGTVILSAGTSLKSTYIESIDANKINAGTISVGLVITSTDNKFIIDFANKFISITV